MSAATVKESPFIRAVEFVQNPQLKAPILHLLDTLFKDKMEELTIDKEPGKMSVRISLQRGYHKTIQEGTFTLPKKIHFEVIQNSIIFPERGAAPLETEYGYIYNSYFYWKKVTLFNPKEYTFLYEGVNRFLVFEEVTFAMKTVESKSITALL